MLNRAAVMAMVVSSSKFRVAYCALTGVIPARRKASTANKVCRTVLKVLSMFNFLLLVTVAKILIIV